MLTIVVVLLFIPLYIYDMKSRGIIRNNKALVSEASGKELGEYANPLTLPIYRFKDREEEVLQKLRKRVVIERIFFVILLIVAIIVFFFF